MDEKIKPKDSNNINNTEGMRKSNRVFINLCVVMLLIIPLIIFLFYYHLINAMSDHGPGVAEFYNIVAVYKQDLKICDALVNRNIRGFYNIATLSDKYRCYWHVARKKQDLNICHEIVKMINTDIAEAKRKYYIGNSENCYRNIAKLKRDLTICEYMETRNKEFCYDDIWRQKAIDMQDSALCEKINSDNIRDSCYKLLKK